MTTLFRLIEIPAIIGIIVFLGFWVEAMVKEWRNARF